MVVSTSAEQTPALTPPEKSSQVKFRLPGALFSSCLHNVIVVAQKTGLDGVISLELSLESLEVRHAGGEVDELPHVTVRGHTHGVART